MYPIHMLINGTTTPGSMLPRVFMDQTVAHNLGGIDSCLFYIGWGRRRIVLGVVDALVRVDELATYKCYAILFKLLLVI